MDGKPIHDSGLKCERCGAPLESGLYTGILDLCASCFEQREQIEREIGRQ